MSGKEEVPKVITTNPDVHNAEILMNPPMTDAQMARQQKIKMKQASDELSDYIKRLRKSNEMKTLQVEELRLGIEYFQYKTEFRELKPKMDALDAREEAEAKEQQKLQKEAYEAHLKEQEKEKKPLIIQTGGGAPRDK